MSFENYDHLQNPIIAVRKSMETVYFNFICSSFFGLPPRKLSKVTDLQDVIGNAAIKVKQQIEKTFNTKSPQVSEEIEIETPKQKYSVVLKTIPYGDEIIIHFLDFSIERILHQKYKQQIIELKETHEQIVKSDKLRALGELIAGISHEISSPLTVATDLLLDLSENLYRGDSKLAQGSLISLQEEFLRIKQIVSNMQSMSKSRSEDLHVLSLKEIVNKSINFVKGLDNFSDVQITYNSKDSFFLGADGKVEQVIVNLLKNAVDAMKGSSSKKIEVKLEKTDHQSFLHVIDNGPGVENPDEIFEMFFTTKEYGDGTGLGLPISRKIMESFHGSLDLLESENGAHFVLQLPSLDIESFTTSNRYLRGECEIEDQKVLVGSINREILDGIFQEFKNKNIVIILSDNLKGLEDLTDSYLVDHVIDTNDLDYTVDQLIAEIEGRLK